MNFAKYVFQISKTCGHLNKAIPRSYACLKNEMKKSDRFQYIQRQQISNSINQVKCRLIYKMIQKKKKKLQNFQFQKIKNN